MISLALPRLSVSLGTIRELRWPIRRLGPYSPVLGFAVLSLALLGLSRAALIAWQWHRVGSAQDVFTMLMQGARSDLITIGFFAAPIVIVLPVFVALKRTAAWIRCAGVWLAICLTAMLFMEFATPQFLLEYDSRPNRVFIEYLAYPAEVFGMLWNGYRILLIGTIASLLATAWLCMRHFARYAACVDTWRARTVLCVWPLVVVLLFVMVRSSFQHRPANLATFAFSDDAMVNSLVANSAYTVLTAIYGLKNEHLSSDMYGEMSEDEMLQIARSGMGISAADFTSDRLPTLHRQLATVRRERPRNLVIVLEESLGAGFVEALGGRAIAPNLTRLAKQGIWFDQLYATGTRSVRGIEAVVAGFPPTPAQSVVKLNKSQSDFATLASVLRTRGYHNEFVYGGESHFDNMRGFFLGNGFHTIVDRGDFKAPVFVGSWGVSDEDLFAKAHDRIASLHALGKPFFLLVFSSSNHTPFEFPDGRIELVDADKHTVDNAVRYADHAMGDFVDRSRRSEFWADTLMMVVADHDTRVYGEELVPIDKFHIPGVILGADIEPKRIESLASQIDLAPTLLSLMGVDSEHPFPGRDLTRTLPEFGGDATRWPPRAMMQFDRNFAWMEDGRVTVLLPGQVARGFTYDRDARVLAPAALDASLAHKALANALLPAWLYREERYRLREHE